jgi:hypothetical protein
MSGGQLQIQARVDPVALSLNSMGNRLETHLISDKRLRSDSRLKTQMRFLFFFFFFQY